jgi:hypothetical protein
MEIRTYRSQAVLDAALRAQSRYPYCGIRALGDRWMIVVNTGDAAALAESRIGGRVLELPGCTPGAPGWNDPPYDVQALGCEKGAPARVNVQLRNVGPRPRGDIKFSVTNTGPRGRATLFSAGAAIESPLVWQIPLVVPDGCGGHTQTITITNNDPKAKRSAVERLTFARRPDGVLVANVRPTLR